MNMFYSSLFFPIDVFIFTLTCAQLEPLRCWIDTDPTRRRSNWPAEPMVSLRWTNIIIDVPPAWLWTVMDCPSRRTTAIRRRWGPIRRRSPQWQPWSCITGKLTWKSFCCWPFFFSFLFFPFLFAVVVVHILLVQMMDELLHLWLHLSNKWIYDIHWKP